MWRLTSALIALTFVPVTLGSALAVDDNEEWNKTRSIKELPFCAFILRDFLGEFQPSREIYILMEPDQVTENNLLLLFNVVSQKYPKPLTLRIWVYTDVEDLASIATNVIVTGSPPEQKSETISAGEGDSPKRKEKEDKRRTQWAYYRRTKEVELFRYNPNYPEQGMKTVILRGKE